MSSQIKKQIKISSSLEETFEFGRELGKNCQGGEVFLLFGDLGAGKTSLLQGLGAGLGYKKQINSPTFNILKLYNVGNDEKNLKKDKNNKVNNQVKIKLFCHIDAYRLSSAEDLVKLGVDEYFNSFDTVSALEWAEKVESAWPREVIKIKLKTLSENKREIKIF